MPAYEMNTLTSSAIYSTLSLFVYVLETASGSRPGAVSPFYHGKSYGARSIVGSGGGSEPAKLSPFLYRKVGQFSVITTGGVRITHASTSRSQQANNTVHLSISNFFANRSRRTAQGRLENS
ncbi:hypothetical protein QUF76_01980 [Desulfobacterales bacterium HSG16]|nr:hypothetical protein [Desulfobacterales bacterium HSG16]